MNKRNGERLRFDFPFFVIYGGHRRISQRDRQAMMCDVKLIAHLFFSFPQRLKIFFCSKRVNELCRWKYECNAPARLENKILHMKTV